MLEREIALPGLETPCTQLVVPLRAGGRTLGALLVESENDQFFSYDDEDALVVLGGQLGSAVLICEMRDAEEDGGPRAPAPPPDEAAGPPIRIQRYAQDDSVFVDGHYMIKGVAGAILWKLACEFLADGRSEFTTRELRLSGSELRLPELQDNLSARMLLLERRLAERRAGIARERTGRGRYRLVTERPLHLVDDGAIVGTTAGAASAPPAGSPVAAEAGG